MLKQKAHLLPDFAHAVKSQSNDILAVDTNRSRVGCFEADDEPQQHALSRAAAAQHGQGLAAAHAEIDPIENSVGAEGLEQILDGDKRRLAVLSGPLLLRRYVTCRGHSYLTNR